MDLVSLKLTIRRKCSCRAKVPACCGNS